MMCGRGGLDYDWSTLWNYFNLAGEPPDGGLRILNLAPSYKTREGIHWNRVPVVVSDDEQRQPRGMIWPLIPRWLKGELPKFSTANCRSEPDRSFTETVSGKPTFREAWKRDRRCLVPFSWFYEWDQRSQPKQPWRILPNHGPVLVMAGLWEPSTAADGDSLQSFTIVTTSPNRLLTEIGHHRSPVMLAETDWDTWLNGDKAEAETLIHPPPDNWMKAHRVTRQVNNPGFQGEELLNENWDEG